MQPANAKNLQLQISDHDRGANFTNAHHNGHTTNTTNLKHTSTNFTNGQASRHFRMAIYIDTNKSNTALNTNNTATF